MNNNLFLIDFNNLVYRFHFAFMRNPLRNKNGFNTSAIYGTINFTNEIIKKYDIEYIVFARDLKEKTFRHEVFESYKSDRETTPDELNEQIPYIIEFLQAMGINVLSKQGYEADDIIGSLGKQFYNDFDKIFIVTSDKDMGQLLNDKTFILLPKKEKNTYPVLGIKEIEEKLNIKINQILDYYALIGDKVDSIPGIDGIGPKTAARILKSYNSIFEIIENPDKIKSEKIRQKILNDFENLKLYRELVKIKTDINLKIKKDDLRISDINIKKINDFIDKFQLYSLKKYYTSEKKIETAFDKINNIDDILNEKNIVITEYENKLIIAGKNAWAFLKHNDLKNISNKNIFVDSLKKYPSIFILMKNNNIYDLHILNTLQNIKGNIKNIIQSYSNEFFDLNENNKLSILLCRISDKLLHDIENGINFDIYKNIELPIIPAIKKMEDYGLKIDRDFFENKKNSIIEELKIKENEIFNIAGESFNINSPKQLQEILFYRLGIKPLKKIKTGYSTDSSVLEKLALLHPIAKLILEYREMNKLLTGFIEPILNLTKNTDFIHTTLDQSHTSTGRFASKNPNMQNIPPEIRKGFIPSKNNYKFLSIDYSQIELRILAFLSKDKNLLTAFENNRDVHKETAMRIFNVFEQAVTKDLRSIAKIVNFSVIYGKTAFGLAQQLNIRKKDAEQFIEKYFEEYSGVKKWIENIILESRKTNISKTYFGRTRILHEINSQNKTIRQASERVAINSPIQGTAADIIKIAIKNVHEYIKDKEDQVKMILTIHDELLFEIKEDIDNDIIEHIEQLMINIKPFDKILSVNKKIGSNWYECK